MQMKLVLTFTNEYSSSDLLFATFLHFFVSAPWSGISSWTSIGLKLAWQTHRLKLTDATFIQRSAGISRNARITSVRALRGMLCHS
jgi:hypothetical protein